MELSCCPKWASYLIAIPKLGQEVKKKFAAGYPRDNILFQSPQQVILWQDGQEVLNTPIDEPRDLVRALQYFFEYEPPALEAWEQAVEDFKEILPMLAEELTLRGWISSPKLFI